MTNPLLTPFSLPPFSAIKPEHVVPAVTKALEDCRAAVESAVAHGAVRFCRRAWVAIRGWRRGRGLRCTAVITPG